MNRRYFQEDTAIVLRSKPLRERDRLVTLLSEKHGKITGVAKGALHSRRFGAAFDLFTCVDLRFKESPGRELVRIEEAKIRHDFLPIRKDLEKITAASYFADLALRLTEEREEVREIFLLLAHFLFLLEKNPMTLEMMRAFEIKLLDRLGFSINLEKCVSCEADLLQEGKEYKVLLDKGGFLCGNCAVGMSGKIKSDNLLQLQRLSLLKIKELPSQKISADLLRELQILMQNFLCYYGPGLQNYKFPTQIFLQDLQNSSL